MYVCICVCVFLRERGEERREEREKRKERECVRACISISIYIMQKHVITTMLYLNAIVTLLEISYVVATPSIHQEDMERSLPRP